MLTQLLARFPAYTIVERPAPTLLARYRNVLPPEVLVVWEEYGFGTFCEGYLKIVNPDDYADLLAETYQLTSTSSTTSAIVLFATGMGDLLIWEDGYLSLVNYRYGLTKILSEGTDFFFNDLATEDFLVEDLQWEPYPAARKQLGEPAFDECFGYVPLLVLGGTENVAQLEKVKLREHISLIGQVSGILER